MSEAKVTPNERIVVIGSQPTDASVAGLSPPVANLPKQWRDVPWRTIVGAVFVVVATVIAIEVVVLTVRIIAWIFLAGFFAIVLAPAVSRLQRRVGGRRGVATGLVVFCTLAIVIGSLSLFVVPLRDQVISIFTDLPGTVRHAADGSGAVGRVITRLHLNSFVKEHEVQLSRAADRIAGDMFGVATTALNAILAFVTITVMTFLFLTQSEALGNAFLSFVPIQRRDGVRRAASDAAGAVGGYMVGNLIISLIAGVSTLICLVIMGVPNPLAISLWVAFADLIPLLGAILGAFVGVLAAFLHGSTAGIVVLIFFVVYQQIENGVLYPTVMARKVKVNPLVVLLSVLLAVEVFGLLGALLAVPASGALQVIVRAVRYERRGERLIVPASSGGRRRPR